MSKRFTVVARKACEHCGRPVAQGEVLEVEPVYALKMLYRREAILAPEDDKPPNGNGHYRRRDMRARP
jgi:hypothetical protein